MRPDGILDSDQEESHTTMTESNTAARPAFAAAPGASIRTEPVQQRSTERITNLLDTAAALIDERGIDGLTTSDVATSSGSSVGVVYRYFPNIQSLLRALAARNMQKFSDRIFGSMAERPEDWMDALNAGIDAYADLSRTEPGFRALGFGDVIAKRFLDPELSNNAVLAGEFNELLTKKYGVVPSDELAFDLEVVVGIGDALLNRAFLYDRDGDPRFIEKLRELVRVTMAPHAGNPAGR
jgi:AcrR family transcriptional regulator